MSIFSFLLKKRPVHQPEDDFVVTVTDTFIKVEHPRRATEQVLWENTIEIRFINTDGGPVAPDVWLALLGKDDGCLIPQGAKGFDEVYEKVSKYEGFNFENVTQSMRCTENKEFLLWSKPD